jgi:uncharacterized protein (DUF1330 family)
MTAYLILNYEIEDADAYGDYISKAPAALGIPADARPLVVGGNTEQIEGEGAGTNTVVLQFDSREKAKEIYESGDYQAIVGTRLGATTKHFAILVDGLG